MERFRHSLEVWGSGLRKVLRARLRRNSLKNAMILVCFLRGPKFSCQVRPAWFCSVRGSPSIHVKVWCSCSASLQARSVHVKAGPLGFASSQSPNTKCTVYMSSLLRLFSVPEAPKLFCSRPESRSRLLCPRSLMLKARSPGTNSHGLRQQAALQQLCDTCLAFVDDDLNPRSERSQVVVMIFRFLDHAQTKSIECKVEGMGSGRSRQKHSFARYGYFVEIVSCVAPV